MVGAQAPLSQNPGRLIALVSGLLLAVAGCTSQAPAPEQPQEEVVDLLQQDWQHVPGVTADGDGLRVSATASTILGHDNGGRQPNPPLNLAGTHLVTEGDFSLSALFTDVTADASWAVYDSPPVIADEFRIEPAGLRLILNGDDLEVIVFDGSPQQDVTDPRPVYDEHVTVPDPQAAVSVRRSGDTLEIASAGSTVSSVPFGGVFASGALWLGLSSDEGSFRVGSLTATAAEGTSLRAAGPAVTQAEPSAQGLQALADRARPDFTIGAAVALGPLASDADYAQEFVGHFGGITPENAMKPQFLSPQRGVYTFEEADALLAMAESKGMRVHGHTIAFTEAMPRWMKELPTASGEERRASADALLDYVTTVVTHFRGRLASLDVVNEPFDLDQGTSLQENIWYRTFGPDYPAIVSRAVYDADPDVRQFVNENGADVPGDRQDALLELARDTNARGGHIYGVGLQSHVYDLETDAISTEDLTATLDLFERAGLHVRISENDVTDDRGTDAQAEQYAAVLATCLRSPTCVSYTTWGVDDRYDWWIDDDGGLQQGHDYLFDEGHPTPAHEAMVRALTSAQ
ncbi:endo-1,4-beta-xylanase [Kineosporia sp. NBRC 101731]|uniref:endo-1,4-beta-xylanase n=1 Tax=Kineosporia sp. NBRC 101731 TaxID=3032199 RepID=UPI0024A542EA|nr:endo-1,4-beta-xylanase [Kineosporia sp. NBRC 101731]GLY29689.1 beta-xylanase [Kineosporia sp. NBRC 101731]